MKFDVTASLVAGDAESIIGTTVKEQEIDVLVMGAPVAMLFASNASATFPPAEPFAHDPTGRPATPFRFPR